MEKSKLDKQGFEIPDPKPMALPVGFVAPPTLTEMVRNLVRYEVSRAAASEGEETWEEADDFVVGDEPELQSPYELDDEQQSGSLREFIEERPKEPEKPVSGKPEEDLKAKPEPTPIAAADEKKSAGS